MPKKNNNRKSNKNRTSNKKSQAKRRGYNTQSKKSKRVEAPYPHFRYYNKSKHPALIVGEQESVKTNTKGVDNVVEEYQYRKVMHTKKDGNRNNEMVYPNPDPNDEDPMYIGKRVRHDDKENFENYPLPWVYRGNKK